VPVSSSFPAPQFVREEDAREYLDYYDSRNSAENHHSEQQELFFALRIRFNPLGRKMYKLDPPPCENPIAVPVKNGIRSSDVNMPEVISVFFDWHQPIGRAVLIQRYVAFRTWLRGIIDFEQ